MEITRKLFIAIHWEIYSNISHMYPMLDNGHFLDYWAIWLILNLWFICKWSICKRVPYAVYRKLYSDIALMLLNVIFFSLENWMLQKGNRRTERWIHPRSSACYRFIFLGSHKTVYFTNFYGILVFKSFSIRAQIN